MDPLDRAWPHILSTFREVTGRQPTFDEQAALLTAFRHGQDVALVSEELAEECYLPEEADHDEYGPDRLAGILWEEGVC